MPSLIPSPYPVVHYARSESGTDPDTGNPIVVTADPVIRKIQGISQIGQIRGSSRVEFTPDFVQRVETLLHISVADGTPYSPGDDVILFPTLDDGDYVADTGTAFTIDGVGNDASLSPWPAWSKAFGTTLRIRRVT